MSSTSAAARSAGPTMTGPGEPCSGKPRPEKTWLGKTRPGKTGRRRLRPTVAVPPWRAMYPAVPPGPAIGRLPLVRPTGPGSARRSGATAAGTAYADPGHPLGGDRPAAAHRDRGLLRSVTLARDPARSSPLT